MSIRAFRHITKSSTAARRTADDEFVECKQIFISKKDFRADKIPI